MASVFSVGVAWAEPRDPRHGRMVESMARPQYRRVPMIFWIRDFRSGEEEGGGVGIVGHLLFRTVGGFFSMDEVSVVVVWR